MKVTTQLNQRVSTKIGRKLLTAVVIGGAIVATANAQPREDVLLIERMDRTKEVATPRRGTSKAQVEQRYGAPSEKVAAVGEPPISRWVYPSFTVYFEYQHVVHAVVNKASDTETPAEPPARS